MVSHLFPDFSPHALLPVLLILLDILLGPIEKLRFVMDLVFEQRLAQRHSNLSFAGVGILPATKAYVPNDLVDVSRAALNDEGS